MQRQLQRHFGEGGLLVFDGDRLFFNQLIFALKSNLISLYYCVASLSGLLQLGIDLNLPQQQCTKLVCVHLGNLFWCGA